MAGSAAACASPTSSATKQCSALEKMARSFSSESLSAVSRVRQLSKFDLEQPNSWRKSVIHLCAAGLCHESR